MKQLSNITYREALLRASSFLKEQQKDDAIAKWFLWDLIDCDLTQWLQKQDDIIPEDVNHSYMRGIHRVAYEDFPWQYLTGIAWFYGEKFNINPHTLIPRQETEDLVSHVLRLLKHRENQRILEIGTGSGIIAITLAMASPNHNIIATDISKEALAVAKENGKRFDVTIDWRHGDLFEPVKNEAAFDFILSNPPYISREEQDVMGKDVVKFEPEQALYAEENGYAIYLAILEQIETYLKPNGILLVEIGYQQGAFLRNVYADAFPHSTVEILKDYTGTDRMLLMQYKKGDTTC